LKPEKLFLIVWIYTPHPHPITDTQAKILFSYPVPDQAIFLMTDWAISLLATAILVMYANCEDLLQVVTR